MSIERFLNEVVSNNHNWPYYLDAREAGNKLKEIKREDELNGYTETFREVARSQGHGRYLEMLLNESRDQTGSTTFFVVWGNNKVYVVDLGGVSAVINTRGAVSIESKRNTAVRVLNTGYGSWERDDLAELQARMERELVEGREREERERRERAEREERNRIEGERREQERRERVEREEALRRTKNPNLNRAFSLLLSRSQNIRVPSKWTRQWGAMVSKYEGKNPPYKLTPMESIVFEDVWNLNN